MTKDKEKPIDKFENDKCHVYQLRYISTKDGGHGIVVHSICVGHAINLEWYKQRHPELFTNKGTYTLGRVTDSIIV